MKKAACFTFFFLVVATMTFVVGLRSQSIPRNPYVLTVKQENFRNNAPSPDDAVTITYAALANGSTSMETRHSSQGNRAPIQEIKDIVKGQVTIIDHNQKIYYSAPLSASAIERGVAPVLSDCNARFSVPCKASEKILNQETFVVEIAPGGSGMLQKMWVSPAVAWAPLREEHYMNGRMISRVTAESLVIGASAEPVFQVPPAYKKLSSLDAYTKESLENRGEKVPEESLRGIREREALKRSNLGNTAGANLRMRAFQAFGR